MPLWVFVCSLSLPDSMSLSQSLPVRGGDPCVGLGIPALGQEGAASLLFLSGLSTAVGPLHRVIPFQLITSPYQMEWRVFCTLWLQNFISAKILLIVGVNWWKINQKSVGREQVDLAPTYSTAILGSFNIRVLMANTKLLLHIDFCYVIWGFYNFMSKFLRFLSICTYYV